MIHNDLGRLQMRDDEFHFPPPSDDMKHFNAVMPAGAILVIAEDRLHREAYQGDGSAEDLERHKNDVEKYDQTKCAAPDFDAYRAQGDFKAEVRPLAATAPFQNLPLDPDNHMESTQDRYPIEAYRERDKEARDLAHDVLKKNEEVAHG